jgi:hypothetical protein
VLLDDLHGEQVDDIAGDVVLVGLEVREGVLGGDSLGDVALRHVPLADEDLAQELARDALLGEGFFDLLLGDDPLLEQDLTQSALGHPLHGSFPSSRPLTTDRKYYIPTPQSRQRQCAENGGLPRGGSWP